MLNEQLNQAIDLLKTGQHLSEEEKTSIASVLTAQAREAQIQLALESVRARTMAMQHSEELQNIALLLFKQVQSFGIQPFACGFNIWDEDKSAATAWMAQEGAFQPPFKTSSSEDVFLKIFEAAQRGESLFVEEQAGEKLEMHYSYMASIPTFRDVMEKMSRAGLSVPTYQIIHCAFFSHGYLMFISYEPVPEAHDIFIRFAKVFDQTYTRFLDLQKAEAQAREAKIEFALEKVRSRSMAMHKSEEVMDVAVTVYDELQSLDFKFGAATIIIMDKDTGYMQHWLAGFMQKNHVESYEVNNIDNPLHAEQLAAWRKGEKFISIEVSGQPLKDYTEEVLTQTGYKNLPAEEKAMLSANEHAVFNLAFMNHGALMWAPTPLSEEKVIILQRFAKVFEQTYTRFLDLQKAEAQAREAQIEAALEKVRSRSLTMHSSNELGEVVDIVFEKLHELKIIFDGGVAIQTFNEGSKDSISWVTDPRLSSSYAFDLPYPENIINNQRIISDFWDGKEKGIDLISHAYSFEDKNAYFNYVFKYSELRRLPDDVKKTILSTEGYAHSVALEKNSAITVSSFLGKLLSGEENEILKRFAMVFEQAYIRYLDLQKAEAQAREAQIELGLERVRARAMAMQKSDELLEISFLLFQEAKELGVTAIQNSIGIVNEETGFVELSTTVHGSRSVQTFNVPIDEPFLMAKAVAAWKAKHKLLTLEFEGQELKDYNELRNSYRETKVNFPEDHWIVNICFFSQGWLSFSSDKRVSDEMVYVLKRFAIVFEQTYTRFLDLKKAEAQAREAIKASSLDRVRAQTASMRTTADLDTITPLIWKELTVLGIPFIRCGVFIMNELQQLVQTFLSTPDGKSLAAFHMPYKTPGVIEEVVRQWHNKKNFIAHWDETGFKEFADSLVKQGAISSAEQYLTSIPTEGFYLHFIPFLQGMLYVGNTSKLPDDEMKLIQSLTDAFSTAYARYEDFNKLEAAKQQVDKTLVELKQAQQQLIQSEKMASLGELTAGIAHEIQNPLNFINNFSEVNTELIEELKSEKSKLKSEELDELLNDIAENEQKINHHGKRADAIVKGMLQHSRANAGKKEPTDINALADEYLRLSYHGLRAKDKDLNADFNTDFDQTIGKIEVVPQDIGRVLLNLYNNAFYAVSERCKVEGVGYKPTVWVTTKHSSSLSFREGRGEVKITVKDNGSGIPQKVVDKIFQPFFTTKPTGQGTGLGLSLSYDIIKAHGGEIKVESKEGEGSQFIISLQVSNNI